MLDRRFRLQRMSHKHTHHLCKATLTVCTPDLKAPDLHWTIGDFSEILIHVVFDFLESFIKWSAGCSHCNQEGPFPAKKTCLVFMKRSHLQQTLRVDQTCYWCCRMWCRLLNYCQLLLLATEGQFDQYRQVPCKFLYFRPRHSVDCNTCSTTTLKLYVILMSW